MSYELHAARTVDDATALLARLGEDATVLAGGTAFALLWKQGLIRPAHVVDIHALAELRGISRLADGGLRIGALATHREAERDPHVHAYCPALADTFAHVATIRVRNQATVGGNLAHADPAQDPPVMLLALDAVAVARSARGERRIPLAALFVDQLATSLEPDELITEVVLPPLAGGTRAVYRKFLPRTADDYATVSVAVMRSPDGATRVALGSVASTPVRAAACERALSGGASAADAARLVDEAIDPLDDARGPASYKRRMARVWTERALREVLA